jgi:hypothetical protein
MQMGLGVLFDLGPIRGAETFDCALEKACLLSPILLKEALAPNTVGRLAFFTRIGFFETVDWGFFVLVERQGVFDLESLVHVIEN